MLKEHFCSAIENENLSSGIQVTKWKKEKKSLCHHFHLYLKVFVMFLIRNATMYNEKTI